MHSILGVVLALAASASALYSSSDDVIELTASNFNKMVIQSDDLWLVEFYAPWCGHCKNLAPEWKKAASALKGIVKVGAVDMDQHSSVGGPYNVRGFPTIKIFGANKNSPQDYNGQRSAQSIVETAMSTAKQMVNDRLQGKSSGSKKSSGGSGGGQKQGSSDDVIELTDSNFEDLVLNSDDLWLVEFFAPWCGHCKNLAPHWASAATELKGKVKLGALDATVHTIMAGRYGIEMLPTIMLFPYNKQDDILLYQGGHTSEDLVLFAMEHYTDFLDPPEIKEVRGYPTIKVFPQGKKDGEAQEYEGGRTSSDIVAYALERFSENVPPPELVQLTGQGVLDAACEDHQLCVVAVLPHILDCQSKCRNNYLNTMREMGEKYKKRQWGWVWAEAGAQPEVEEALGIGGFGYPAMAAMNARKMKYALLRGSFSETGINEFLRELAVGRGSTAPVKNAQLPKVLDTDGWDGKDGQLPVVEEIDLSDIDLDDLDDINKDEL